MKPQPLIAVRDVEASSRWYQTLLGCKSGYAGKEYGALVRDGELLLQLHGWHDPHPNLGDPGKALHGYGVLLWFETEAFDATVERAAALRAEVLLDVHVNPHAGHREICLRDMDGYVVVIASGKGEPR
jgi:catechol 2,3-dioxygenase-like lactoylglutathione lyase family enzyme